jgi:phosphoglycerol transferase MdoB-like AlkP superfamily enzyme
MIKKEWLKGSYAALVSNIALMMALFSICRLLFFLLNRSFFPDTAADQFLPMLIGGMRFDISALAWANIAYAALLIVPLQFRYNAAYQKILKGLFVAVNSILLFGNCADFAYFKFTLRRTTADVFAEFAAESNKGGLFSQFLVDFWYVFFIWILLTLALFFLYRRAKKPNVGGTLRASMIFYAGSTVVLALVALLSVAAMRGGFDRTTRPITLSNAGQYVRKPLEATIVQNTPFCIFRTLGKKPLAKVNFFDSQEALEKSYNPIITPQGGKPFNPMNVVVIIWESLSREHIGALNKDLENGSYKGFTPFVDTLVEQGLTFTSSYANGRKSIEAMPSVLAGIPSLGVPYFLSPYSGNQVNSLASLLKAKGYGSSFFYGSTPSSMGFWAFARMAGFDKFYGQNEYGNMADHDGAWGIWDEDFLQFMAQKLSEQRQPFCASVFTLSSHHPFKIPEKYAAVFPEDERDPMLKCIRYADFAVRRFFETASRQAWYSNTLFVLTADHANRHIFAESQNAADQMAVPVIFFTPNGSVRGMVDNVAQQTDILPTIMGILNYDEPFVAFGQNAIDQSAEQYAVNYINGVYHVFFGQHLLLFDGEKATALYDIKSDRMMKSNIMAQHDGLRQRLEGKAKGFIQQYNSRMVDDCLTVDCKKRQAP